MKILNKNIDRQSLLLKILNMEGEPEDGYGVYFHIKGRKILDLWGAYGANALGYNNEMLCNSLMSFLKENRPNVVFPFEREVTKRLESELGRVSGSIYTKSIFTTGGSESVETALKIASTINRDKYYFITFENSFHGKSIGSLSVTMQPEIRKDIPLLKNVLFSRYNDTISFEKILDKEKKNVAAVILEPIQANGGIIEGNESFLSKVSELCKRHNIILIDDEVSTGLGRTGKWFAFQQYTKFNPDIICIAKHLGGGLFPLGASMISKDILSRYNLDTISLSFTFSSQSIAHYIGCKVIEFIESNNLLSNVEKIGSYLIDGLKRIKENFPDRIMDVRGRGLIIGIELHPFIYKKLPNIYTLAVIRELFVNHNILVGLTSSNPSVIRLHPPFIINREQVDEFLNALAKVLSKNPLSLIGNLIKNGIL
ncbi:MAG: aspartate aminotransferase family protein [Myxococcota bacterium]